MVINWLKKVDSTNSVANAAAAEASDLTVWVAEYQSAGRGQRGNRWESSAGMNLTFSILLKPDNLLAINQFAISQITALAVLDYLSGHGLEASVKWPNDIYVGDKKICGILIENKISYDKVSASVVGLGININQKLFPFDLLNPTSLILETGAPQDYQLEDELVRFMDAFVKAYTYRNLEVLQQKYVSSLYRLNEEHQFYDRRGMDALLPNGCYSQEQLDGEKMDVTRVFRAKITGVNPDNGCLEVCRIPSGEYDQFSFKEISYVL